MKKKLIFVGPVLLVVIAAAFFFLKPSAPAKAGNPAKEPGPVYTMTDPFVVNLADRSEPHLAKVGVAMQLSKASAGLLPGGHSKEPPKLEMDAELRDIVISALQSHTAAQLSTPAGRLAVKKQIVADVNKHTEVKILDVYYTEFAVQ